MQKRNASVAVIGAGDYIGAEIAKKFAAEGFDVFAGRRNGEKLEPLLLTTWKTLTVFFISVILLPLAMLIAGVAVYLHRRTLR